MENIGFELKPVLEKVLKEVSEVLGDEYVLDNEGAIEFEFSLLFVKEAGGKLDVKLAKAGGQISKEKLHKVKFRVMKLTETEKARQMALKAAYGNIAKNP